ncbi:WRB/Get1 family [Polychytrium aggregatum]|uniref:WRB/Get1 family n=1 Tax=Polychytrium aggregatum TaxID=110093 RepID=UPI0022FEEF31|nr:WRB/Get1 family [Polychytrium aggregatum]KAI9204365.1 WRB/Get1 family [Polychytrium aggregatum]
MHPALNVLICSFLIQLLEIVGYSFIAKQVYLLLSWLSNPAQQRQAEKEKREILDLKNELSSVNAQDEFAKWAKLRRQLDKKVAAFETSGRDRGLQKATFEFQISWGLWLTFWIVKLFLMFTYRASPMFYVRKSWLGPFYYFISLPFAPKGSVSVIYWFFACQNVFTRLLKSIVAATAARATPAQTTSAATAN